MSVRKINREKLGFFGPDDTDGHRVTYIGPDGNLYFGDISGHTKSLVYGPADPEFGRAPGWQTSRDFLMMALMLSKTKTRPSTLAVIKTDGTPKPCTCVRRQQVVTLFACSSTQDVNRQLSLQGGEDL
jgi:hypothetical protein